MIRPVILCGGGGTRLWPLSNPRRPKQFLSLAGTQSMLAQTVARVSDPTRFSRPLAIGASRHANLLSECIPSATLLLEPVGRNSAPPIAAASLLSAEDEFLLVLPADQHIADVDAFRAAIDLGMLAAAENQIVTFGVQPDHPATSYGYIEAGEGDAIRSVERFVEKPDEITAAAYLETGNFLWNAGILLFQARVMLAALELYAPDILMSVRSALQETTLDRVRFASTRSESIDFAVLEHAQNISVVPVSMGWSDLGDFQALHAAAASSTEDGVVGTGHVAASDSSDVYIRGEGVRVAVHGVNDLAVVATPDSVLVTRLSDAGSIKDVIAAVEDRSELIRPDQRTWLQAWLWNSVMPFWAKHAIDERNGGLIECIGLDGRPQPDTPRRGRIAPRQLFAFARAKRLGWNPNGAADRVINAALAFLESNGRSKRGGWSHCFRGDGSASDERRDLYDHAFIALAGSELASLGDHRGLALASEAFSLVDTIFFDRELGGWHDPETAPGTKRANPHMHLLEASLAHFEYLEDPVSLERVKTIAALFERWMFDPQTGALIEDFNADWSRGSQFRIEPGHCFEWAFLLNEVERLTGRDTASWRRRLVDYAESKGTMRGLVMDELDQAKVSFRLWPQLERLRAFIHTPRPGTDIPGFLDRIIQLYLNAPAIGGWTDSLDGAHAPNCSTVPASMLYHLMTGLAPLAPPTSRVAHKGIWLPARHVNT